LFGGDALGELLALEVTLEDVVRPLLSFGSALGLLEELAAQGAPEEAVNGLDFLEDLCPALFEL
jgi:hypothetical protein